MEINIFYSHLLSIPAIAFLVTVLIKGISVKMKTGKIDIAKAFGSGGMPSVHSSVVVSLSTAMALKYGVDSDMFALSMAFTVIIIYDAMNVRFEAGLHASAINKYLGRKQFKESLGHLPSETFAGSMVGILIALALYLV
ncbi:MAG: divergent PAP2 family protein [Candidatus Gracilibacteria bacterium]|nr:divergent PAP2 family protein [Candidatus Gracilibacteria bacterium]